MIEIFWGILNIIAFFAFIFISFYAVKLVKQKLGLIACIIFIIGFLSFITFDKSNIEAKNNKFDYQKVNKKDNAQGNQTGLKSKTIKLNSANSIDLLVKYEIKNNEAIPIYSSSTLIGFVSGFEWSPQSINLIKIHDRDYEYQIEGNYEWRLINFKLYTQNKNFRGVIVL